MGNVGVTHVTEDNIESQNSVLTFHVVDESSTPSEEEEQPLIVAKHIVPYRKKNDESIFRVSTLAGNGSTNTQDGIGKNAGINWPYEIKFTKDGDGIFTAYGSCSVRKVTPEGHVTTILDQPHVLDCPRGIALDAAGNIYVVDSVNNVIRKITPDGICKSVPTKLTMSSPYSVAVTKSGNLIVSEPYRHCIRTIFPNGNITILAGSLNYAGYLDEVGSAARFCRPQGLVLDSEENVIVADTGNNIIRKITPEGCVTTICGGNDEFSSPYGVALDRNDNIYVADYGNNRIRKITKTGKIVTVAGTGASVFEDEPRRMSMPTGLAVDARGNLIVCDCYNHMIRKVSYRIDLIAQDWPSSHTTLSTECQRGLEEFVLILKERPPVHTPKEIKLLLIREMIVCWPA